MMSRTETHLVHMHTVSQPYTCASADSTLTVLKGAPETCRMDRALESEDLQVKQDVDIWSMGCVYSEVTTWVGHGWNKVDEYRRRRREEFKKKTDTDGECFHDGRNILGTVEQIHTETISNRRISDHVTPSVLENLVQNMMITDESRLDAIFVFQSSKRIIKKAKATVDEKTHNIAHREKGHAAFEGGQPQLPPNLPPGLDIGTRKGSPHTSESSQDRDTKSNGSSPNGRPFSPASPYDGLSVGGHQMSNHSRYGEPPLTPTRPGRVSTAPQQPLGRVQQNQHTFKTSKEGQVESLSNNRFNPLIENDMSRADLSQTFARRETRNFPLQDLPGIFDPAANVPFQNLASRGSLTQSDPHPHNGLATSTTQPLRTVLEQRRHPVLLVDEGLQWKADREIGKNHKLNDEELLDELKGRDHVSLLSCLIRLC